MNIKQDILIELIRERERITLLIAELQQELSLIEKIIERRSSEDVDETKRYSSVTKFSALKPQKALERIFKENQTTNFLPNQLSVELMRMAKQGQLISQSKNLLNVVHTALKALVKKGLVIKHAELNPPRYRWNIEGLESYKKEMTEEETEQKN